MVTESELDEIPVEVVFELGRMELTVGELRQLAPGTIAPLKRPFEEAFDIVANGKRIGRGVPVRIGDQLGIRITRVANDV